MRLTLGGMTVAITLVAVGCTATPPGVSNAYGTEYLELALSDAYASGEASAEQIAILRSAVESGTISLDDELAAIDRTLACFDESGIEYIGPFPDDSMGFLRYIYAAQVGFSGDGLAWRDEDGDGEFEISITSEPISNVSVDPLAPVAEHCRNRHSIFVEAAFDSQPSSLEAQDLFLEGKRTVIIDCANRLGLSIETDLPIRQLLIDLLRFDEDGRECLREAEITAF